MPFPRRAVLGGALCLFAMPAAALACGRPDNARALREQVIAELNARRRQAGLQALRPAGKLTTAANKHACWMADTGNFSHTGRGGSSEADRVTAEGYDYRFVAENLAAGNATPKQVVDGWMGSAAHRPNVLARQARQVGIGLATGNGMIYWAMLVGRQK